MLPRIRITELLAEVHGWTGFAHRFTHLRNCQTAVDLAALMSAILADGTNLDLSRTLCICRGQLLSSVPKGTTCPTNCWRTSHLWGGSISA